jgi:hypothetical protein
VHHDKNAADLSPDQLRHELADILSRGVLRLRQRQRLAGKDKPKNSLESPPEALRFPEKPCSVSTRVNCSESSPNKEKTC